MFGGLPSQRINHRVGPEIVVGTPGRVIDNIEKGKLKLTDIKTFVVDEAHRMLEDNFIEDLGFIYNHIKKSCKERPQLVMLSATFPEYIMSQIDEFCGKDYEFINLAKNLTNRTPESVNHFALNVERSKRPEVIRHLFNKFVTDTTKKVIVFANTKAGIKELHDSCGIKNAKLLHGDMKQMDRLMVYNDFRKGRINVLFATDVAARGLDIPNLDLVILLEPPNDTDVYVHRAGRTARAGKDGNVISVWDTPLERKRLGDIEESAGIKFKELKFDEIEEKIEETNRQVKFAHRSEEKKKQTRSYWGSNEKNERSEGKRQKREVDNSLFYL
jgi:ATP-dependent RNA helicase DDX21